MASRASRIIRGVCWRRKVSERGKWNGLGWVSDPVEFRVSKGGEADVHRHGLGSQVMRDAVSKTARELRQLTSRRLGFLHPSETLVSARNPPSRFMLFLTSLGSVWLKTG